MNRLEIFYTVLLTVFATVLTRYISFIIFPNPEKMPKFIKYLGKVLPFSVMGLLVIYSFKNTVVFSYPYALPEIIASVAIIFLHFWKKNMLLSIATGTVLYMFLVQKIFI